MSHFVVIGAGQAGFSLVEHLRKGGHSGPITLIGNEAHPPYQRPPLSKAYLLGEMGMERLFFRPDIFYAEHDITLKTELAAVKIDRAGQRVALSDGSQISYDKLALTTGAHPRLLPEAVGGRLAGVYAMRSLADADALAPEFKPGARVLIVGGGYIGLEAAAVAAMRGLKVVLIEAAPRILQRVASAETSDYFRALHRAHGVDIRENCGLVGLVGENGRVTRAKLADGSALDVDFVIVGIGIAPDTALAAAAGLHIDNGIACDSACRTSDPLIFAAGDCASFAQIAGSQGGARMRLESVGNAIDMGATAARAMLGEDVTYTAAPWFWSDQYDCKLQIAGLSAGYDQIVTRQGEGDAVSFWYYAQGRLLAVDAMNDPRAYMVGKRLIEAGATPDAALVADMGVNLKTLLAR
ncbi:MAG: FAD-dependent oxidoreductase [Paracoccaceae bacterium]